MSKFIDWLLMRGDYAPDAQAAAIGNPDVVSSVGLVTPYADQSHLAHVTLADVFPVDPSVLPVTRGAAMSVPPVAKLRHVACGTVGGLPLVAYRGAKRIDEQPTIVAQPEAGRPASVTWTWVVDSLLFYGRAWLEPTTLDRDGRPARVQWVPEWRITVDQDGTVSVDGDCDRGRRLLRIDGPHEGLIRYGSRELRAALDLERTASEQASCPTPAVELHQTEGAPMNREQIRALVDSWVTARRTQRHGVAYTNPNIEARAIGSGVAEKLIIESRRHHALAIARLLGAPAWIVDAEVSGSSLTYSNVPSRSRELIDYFLAPYMTAISSRLSLDDVLPLGTWCAFDTSTLLRGDFESRMRAYSTAIAAGIYTAEECRSFEAGIPLEA